MPSYFSGYVTQSWSVVSTGRMGVSQCRSLSLSQSDINFIEVSSWSGTVTALIVWTQKYSTMKLNSANDENFGSLKPVGSGLFYRHNLLFIETYL